MVWEHAAYARTCLGVNKRYDSSPGLSQVHGPVLGSFLLSSLACTNKRHAVPPVYYYILLEKSQFAPRRRLLIKCMTLVNLADRLELKRIEGTSPLFHTIFFEEGLSAVHITL
jgi:hypothetical protein